MKTLGFILIILFCCFWTVFIKRVLPKDFIDGDNRKIDERQTKMIQETFSNTLVWTVYALLLSIILKFFGISNAYIIPNYPEVGYLLIIIAMLLFSFVYTRYKYSAKG